MSLLVCLAIAFVPGGCPAAPSAAADNGAPDTTNDATVTGVVVVAVPPSNDDATIAEDPESVPPDSSGDATVANPVEPPSGEPGVLRVKTFTDSLAQAAHVIPSGQDAPDDIDVRLTPSAYTVAFKRLVLKQVDEATGVASTEIELFNAAAVEDALVVDLLNATATDLLNVESLPAGTYNKVDIEVFYLDMTIATIYPASESHDIPYRMVFEPMGVLNPRDFLLQLQPEWMEAGSALAGLVTEAGWYWMERENPDNVAPVAGAAAHPTFNVLDLFANDAFWSAEHKVLEGGRINPPLEYDPAQGGVVTIQFDVTGTFDFKDYHDATTPPDGLWEIRRDAGIHPFPPSYECVPAAVQAVGSPSKRHPS
jgi:hypothetical protein